MNNRLYYLNVPDNIYALFEQLLDEYNEACERQSPDQINDAEQALFDLGATVDQKHSLWLPPGVDKADPLLLV